jgi:MFS family permease
VASKAEANVVYAAGLVQGVTLVTFPAASTVFTDPKQYGLSSDQYGLMFVPQVVTAISASLLGTRLAERLGQKRVYLVGLLANLASMTLLLISALLTSNQSVAYGLLLAATGCLGVGFGFTVPAVNTFTAAFHPDSVDTSVLVLNALLGLGTALAPLFVAAFVGLGAWWGLPVTSFALLLVALVVSVRLPLRVAARVRGSRQASGRRIPARFWLFAVFAVLYGVCETMNGNWAQIDMTTQLGASATEASLALTAFWAMVTAGRVLFAAIQRWLPTRRTYHLLPLVLAAAFVLIALLPTGQPALAAATFGLAGLGCSALLPLTISFAQEQLVAISASVAGGVIAFYQLGYGLAAFGVGPLQSAGASLPTLYGWTAVAALAMGALSFRLARRHHEVSHLHPRPSTALRSSA